jgi:outer membrane protein assembly factor BamB/tetratricopeptide (TPR) repeat protein
MSRGIVGLAVLCLLCAPWTGQASGQEEFDPSKVNRWILSLSDDPTKETEIAELHAYLKKHGKLALIYSKFEESFERRPKDAKIRFLMGKLHLRDGNRAGALKCFAAAAQADGDYAYTYLAQAELFQEQGDEKGLVAALEGVIQSSKEKPAVVGAIRKLAAYYGKKQELDRAASLWALLGERFPADAELLAEAVKGVEGAGKLPRAVECLRAALGAKGLAASDRARFYLELSALERRTGRTADAGRSLALASEAAGDDPVLARKIDESVLAYHREEERLPELAAQREKELAGHETDAVCIWRLARVRMAQSGFRQARDLLSEGLQKNPGNLLLLAGLADVAALQGRHAEVRDLARELARREPGQREHRRRQGLACLELGDFEEAEKAFGAYATGLAEFLEVARIYEKRNRLTDAALQYRRALELKPDAGLSRTLVGILVRLDRETEAEQEAVRCTSGDRERWALLRDLLVQRGEPAKACVYARKDVEANPKDFKACLALAKLQARIASPDAEDTFRKALVLAEKGERGETYEELAGLFSTRGPAHVALLRNEILTRISVDPGEGGYYFALYRLSPPNSMKILEDGRKNDPRHVRLRQELAPYYQQQKQYDVAIDVYKELMEIDPSQRDLYVHAIGEIYWALGHKDEAFSWWAKVKGSSRDKIGLTFQLAKKFEAEKRYPKAIELLQQILKEEPESVLYHWALANLYCQVNFYEGIIQEFKWILAFAKDEGQLRTAKQVLAEKLAGHARAFLEEGNFRLALDELTEALRYAPDEPATGTLVSQVARACEKLRDYPKAAEHYHHLLSRFPGVVVTVAPGRTMNAALFASQQLRANPECLKAYEDQVGGPARALLEESIRKSDWGGLERVIATYPLTAAAGVAAFTLGELQRKAGSSARAAATFERLLAELSLSEVDETHVRVRLVELAALLKDWGTVASQVGELAARSKDKTLSMDGRTVAVKDLVKIWQKELLSHGVGLAASWGLFEKDSRNSSSTQQELSPPLLQKWRFTAGAQNTAPLPSLPPVYAAGGLVFLAKEDILVALDGSSGVVRWTTPLHVQRNRANRQNVQVNVFPLPPEGRLALSQGVVAGIQEDSEIRAFEAATGAALWTHASDIARADGGATGPRNRVRSGVAPPTIEHMEILSATRQCFIVRENDKLRSYALRTGRLEWESVLRTTPLPLAVDPGGGQPNAFPIRMDRLVLESDGIIVHLHGDSIRALDTLSGRELWEIRVPQKAAPAQGPWTAYFTMLADGVSRATISGDLLVYLTATDARLAAVELRTGNLRWEMSVEGPVNESQLGSDDAYLYAFINRTFTVCSMKTGEKIWSRELRGIPAPQRQQGIPPVAVPPNRFSVAGSRIYLTSGDDQNGDAAKLEALDRRSGNPLWEHVWEPLGRLIQGFRALGTDLWGRPIPCQVSAPVICDGWLYVVRSDGLLYSFHGKSLELAALRDAVRKEPDSPQPHFQLGDLLGTEGQASLEIDEYRAALRLAQKKPETQALRELIGELKSRLFARFMKQGESSSDFEGALKAFAEARPYAEGEASTARVLVRTAAVLLAVNREVEAVDVLSSILTYCPSALSPLEGGAETAGDYAKRQLARLGPQARAQWEKAHAEEMEKAFAPGKSVEELEKAIERYSFSSKADVARLRAARVHFDQKRFKEAVQTLDRLRPEFFDQADAESFFEACDLLGRSLAALGEDRRALGTYQKMLSEISRDAQRLGSIKARAEIRHKDLKESWERNGTFSSPLKKIWESSVPAAGAPKPAGPTFDALRPAIDGGKIYALDLQGNLRALDAGTGEVLWQARTEDFSFFFQSVNNLTVLPMDPLLAVKDAIVAVGGKNTRAFDANSGELLWAVPSPDGESAVQQVLIEGTRILTCETRGRVTAREDRTGKILWSTRPGSSASGLMADRSGTSGGGLFYSRIGVEGSRVVAQPAGEPGSLYAYDIATGKQAWKVVDATYQGYLKGRVILEVGYGMACLADPAGNLVCHDLADGKVRWKLNLGLPVEAMVVVPDRIVIATGEQVLLYNAKSGKKEWAAAPDPNPAFPKDRDMRIGATSLAAKGKWLVVGSAGSISILDLATGQIKDQTRPEVQGAGARPGGKPFPFGRSFASVALGPEGIFWGGPTDAGFQWTLLR